MYPDSVITTSKKGKKEVRNFIDYGFFVEYNYIDPDSGKENEKKVKLVLRKKDGKTEEFFIIPTSDGKRFLLIPSEEKGERTIWKNNGPIKLEDLFKEICEK
ncbi:MAG: hypothetical protein ACP5RZ_01025 [Thermoplasmata archaeon]